MWIIKDKGGNQSWTIHEGVALTLAVRGDEVTEVVPASALHASEELVQRLADAILAMYECETTASAGYNVLLRTYGLARVNGKWERVK